MPTSTFWSVIETGRIPLPRRRLLELCRKTEQRRLLSVRRGDLHCEGNARRGVHPHRYDDRRVPGEVPRVHERRIARVRIEVAQPAAFTPSNRSDRWSRECRRDDDVVPVKEWLEVRTPPVPRVVGRPAATLDKSAHRGMPTDARLQLRTVS